METKKIILFLAFLAVSCQAHCQTVRLDRPGDQLIRAREDFYFGTHCLFAGLALAWSPAILPIQHDSPEAVTLRIVGYAAALTGVVWQIESFNHIGRAGAMMNEKGIALKFSGTGIGICYTFGSRKKAPYAGIN